MPTTAVAPRPSYLLVPALGLVLTLVVTLLGVLSGGARAASGAEGGTGGELVGTSIGLRSAAAYAGRPSRATMVVRDEDRARLAGVEVELQRRVEGVWRTQEVVVTDEDGVATAATTLERRPAANVVRATWSGDETYAGSSSERVAVPLLKRPSRVRLVGPDKVVDEESVTLRVRWRILSGDSVAGRVEVQRRVGRDPWKRAHRLRTDEDGRADFSVAPRENTRWRVRGIGQPWVRGARSEVHRLVNVAPGDPVSLPSAAPRPRVRVPEQRRAVGDGANPVITAIPNGVWSQMTGRSWHEGCPVGRPSLRLLRINYWDYTGYRRRGEMVLNADVVGQVSNALAAMYAAKLPLRSMYRPDRFGWNQRLQGADDYKSMAAGNTSAFNCRSVVNMPSRRSPHSYGRAIDLNTWENPYRSADGLVPNAWWQPHSHPRVAWRSRQHQVVAIMARHGIGWTYGLDDTQHFDARPPGSGRMRVPDCGDVVCE